MVFILGAFSSSSLFDQGMRVKKTLIQTLATQPHATPVLVGQDLRVEKTLISMLIQTLVP